MFNVEAVIGSQAGDQKIHHLVGDPELALQRLDIDNHRILCNTSAGNVRLYLPALLRREAFDMLHNPARPSVKASVRLLS